MALMVGYTAGQYLDTPLGFAVYPGRWHFDKGTQGADLAGIPAGVLRSEHGIGRALIAEP